MKTRKFKIKIRASDEDIASNLKQTLKLAEKGLLKKNEYDLILTFPNLSWLSRVFSPERMRLLQVVRKEHPESIYQLAKLLHRQLANVQRDVYELAEFGILVLKKIKKTDTNRESIQPCFEWAGFDIAV
jgi:predicted transcriptional regulator